MKTVIAVRNKPNVFPDGWEVIQESNDWFSVYPLGRLNPNVYLHLCLVAENVSRICFVVFAPNPFMESYLQNIADASPNVWTLAELRADNGVLATALKNIWKDKREDLSPGFFRTMMGHDYSSNLENGD